VSDIRINSTSGIVFNVQSYSIHDGPGIRTVVFLKGCPLSCSWCSNPESQNPLPELGVLDERCTGCATCVRVCPTGAVSMGEDGRPVYDRTKCVLCARCEEACPSRVRKVYGRTVTLSALMGEISRDMPFYVRSGGGVTFSGGEPTMQYDLLLSLLKACKERYIHTAMETCGYLRDREKLDTLLQYLDLALYDVKCIDPDTHRRFTGVDNGLILDNARRIAASGTEMVIRVPIIPGFNDSTEVLAEIGEFVTGLDSVEEVNLLPYHELGRHKYGMLDREYGLGDEEALPEERIQALRDVVESFGLRCTVD
jgi:pyruvate formate lyase activating enzyme